MKYDTISTINTLKALIEEKRGQLNWIKKELDRLQDRLHSCETSEDVARVAADLKDLTAEADVHLKFIADAKKRIDTFYAPASKIA